MNIYNFLKFCFLVFTICFSSWTSADILGQKSKAESIVNNISKWQSSVIKNTTLSDWGLCNFMYLNALVLEAKGVTLPGGADFTIALQGLAAKIARDNFLSLGYSSENLDGLLKSFSTRQLTRADGDYCARWIVRIMDDVK